MIIHMVEVLNSSIKMSRKNFIHNRENRQEFREIKTEIDHLDGQIYFKFMLNLRIKLPYIKGINLYAKIL